MSIFPAPITGRKASNPTAAAITTESCSKRSQSNLLPLRFCCTINISVAYTRNNFRVRDEHFYRALTSESGPPAPPKKALTINEVVYIN